MQLFSKFIVKVFQLFDKMWNIVLNNAPQRIIVNPQITMDQPIPGCDNLRYYVAAAQRGKIKKA
jgi:hypothetical protein